MVVVNSKSFIIILIETTVRVAYYEPAYYEHLFIMNQAEGPNRYILMHLYYIKFA